MSRCIDRLRVCRRFFKIHTQRHYVNSKVSVQYGRDSGYIFVGMGLGGLSRRLMNIHKVRP
jgi:hypothetical protein